MGWDFWVDSMSQKTQAMRVLDGQNMKYEILVYPSGMRDAEEIAAHLNIPPDRVFKTLVVVREGKKPILALIAANKQLSLKKLAKEVSEKKVKMASHKEAENLTGLQVGGISPLALLNKGFTIFIDQPVTEQGSICLSAGLRGSQLLVNVPDLIKVVKPRIAEISD